MNRVVICSVSDAHDHEGEEAEQRGRDRDHGHQPCRTQASQESDETLHRPPPGFGPEGPTGQFLPGDGFHMVNDR